MRLTLLWFGFSSMPVCHYKAVESVSGVLKKALTTILQPLKAHKGQAHYLKKVDTFIDFKNKGVYFKLNKNSKIAFL